MRNVYKVGLIVFALFFITNTMLAQGFSKKKDLKIEQVVSKYDYNRSIKFKDHFNYPEGIGLNENLTDNSEITISVSATNDEVLKFVKYDYSNWAGQKLQYQVPKNTYGVGSLSIKIEYKGVEATVKIDANILPIICKNDEYNLDIADTLYVEVLENDSPFSNLDTNTFEIIQNVNYGVISTQKAGELTYINNTNTPNYTTDSLIYRIADKEGNYDTASVYFYVYKSPYPTVAHDFLPAPGQFVNESIAQSNSAERFVNGEQSMISLGGFGGYVVFGFDQPIVDRDENPYGVDFSINGNAFGAWGGGSWVEPGAVQVMKDENGNGLPDDTWYELAGANYYFNDTYRNLTMTYYNPKYNNRATIPYSTDKGFGGAMRTNQFHGHPYYPDPFDFDKNIKDSVSYTGNLIKFQLDKSNPGYVRAMKWPPFGYVDNHVRNSQPTNPKNPYFADENGPATDGFDLKWAVDASGNSVTLDTVHFIKVYNPSQEDGGWLGEVSTEVTEVAITTPVPNYVPQDYYIHYIGSSQIQVLKNTEIQYQGILFKNGKPSTEGTVTWTSDSTHIATVDNTGLVNTKKCGQTTFRFSQKNGIAPDSIHVEVVELDSIFIQMAGNFSYGNDTIKLFVGEKEFVAVEAEIKGNGSGQSGYGNHNRYPYETYNYFSLDTEIGTINVAGVFAAKKVGITKVVVQSQHYPQLKDTIVVLVKGIPETVAISDTINVHYYKKSFNSNELFVAGDENATVFLDSLKIIGGNILDSAKITKNIFKYYKKPNMFGYDSVKFYVTAYNTHKEINVVFNFIEPDNFASPKQILFVNGGVFGSGPSTQLMSYLTEQDTTIELDNYVGGASSVQDMIVDDNFAYVSADYYITRYNISKKQATDSIHTQDKTMLADGTGADGAGLNNKMAIYKNMLLVTRQNSGSAPEDGYNVRVYNKGDLSFITKISVSNQATDIVVKADKAYVMINGGFAGTTSSMAIIDLKTLTKEKEVDLGTKGLGIMQMLVNGNKIYGIRLGNTYGTTYDAGVLIYDVATESTEEFTYEPNVSYDSSPLAIEPMPNDSTLFVKKDLGYVAFNTKSNTFGTDILFSTTNSSVLAKGSVYDTEDEKYYICYGGWAGTGAGQVYNNAGNSVGIFQGVGVSPEVIKASKQFGANQKPFVVNGTPIKTFKQNQSINFRLDYNAYRDIEDGNKRPVAYLKNPNKYNWLNLDNRIFTGKYTQSLSADTTFNIPIQAFDSHGAFVIDTMKLTITPEDYAPTVANPIADISLPISHEATTIINIENVFTDYDNEDADITKSIISNSTPTFATATLSGNEITINYILAGEGETEIVVEATSNGKTVTDIFTVKVESVDYTKGFFIVNEDWFAHDQGTVNFLKDDGEIVYRAYRRENSGKKLGATTEYSTIYGDKAYFVSKQAPRLVVADAHTLKEIKSIDEIGNAEGRAFLGINENLGYISTSNGIYTFSIANNTVGEKIEGTDGETGNMLLANGSVFAVQQNKILIIKDNVVSSTIEGDTYGGLARTIDGNVWVGAGQNLIKINPYTLTNEKVAIPEAAKTNALWGAWNANSFCASSNENVLYWGEHKGWSPCKNIYKYVIGDETSLNAPFITLAEDWCVYGAGLRIDPISEQIHLTAKKEGWGDNSLKNKIQIFDSQNGNLTKSIQLDDYYWFPAMPMFTDVYAPVSTFSDMVFNKNENKKFSLSDFITDQDNLDLGIVTKVASISNEALLSANVSNDTLSINTKEGQYGIATIELSINSNGKSVTDEFTVTVNAVDEAPTVLNPIADISVDENGTVADIDLTNVFDDIDNENSEIVKTIESNSNEQLLTATISENTLSIVLKANQHGTATIKVKGTSNGKSVTDELTITVNPIDDAPIVANPITDVTADEDGTIANIDLANVFDDIDNENSEIVKTIESNSNEQLLTATISENTLSIVLKANQHGTATIKVKGTSNGKSVTDELTITVNPIDDAPIVANPITDVTADEDGTNANIDLANVFDDIDNENSEIVKTIESNSNEQLLTATISENTLSIVLKANQHGTATIKVKGTSNGKSVTDELTITVNPIDDAPIVVNAIDNLIMEENASDTLISLINVFDDIDNDNSLITIESTSGNNELVQATVEDKNLTLSLGADKTGTTTITLIATSNGKVVYTEFSVDVQPKDGINDQESVVCNVYPNPATEYINISASKKIIKIDIVSISGAIINLPLLEEINNGYRANISSLTQGIYILNIYTDDKKITEQRIIKQ